MGAVSVVVWALTAFGLITPLIVISGSMEPEIMTGDLLIDTANDPADLRAGEVASITSAVTGRIVTHRVVEVHETGPGTWQVTMKGDGNDVGGRRAVRRRRRGLAAGAPAARPGHGAHGRDPAL